ncbi:uncharacterized protein I303_100394 [Kwoniella dejecticola CBS 10117]|uniref:DNA mismatch repair protein Msh6 n=1 Tax=Kwoniella dejecticola CBS 10117 TaxID=1296121 RepID=A0AAJ8MDL0_9TREE
MAKTTPSQPKATKQSSIASFFGAPKPGPRPPSTSSPATGKSARAATVAGPASSPVVRTTQGKDLIGSSPALGKRNNFVESEDELTPPPDSGPSSAKTSSGGKKVTDEENDIEMEEDGVAADGSPIKVGRRAKRKVMYVESDSGASDEEMVTKTSRKPRKSLKAESDEDDFVFDEADDAAFEYEASVISRSPSPFSASPEPIKKKPAPKKGFVAPTSVPKKPTTSWNVAESSSRPGPRPLPNGKGKSAQSNNSETMFLTRAELSKLEAKEQQRASETCFDFLKDPKDRDKHAPDHPDYDKRTLYIPPSKFTQKGAFTPFEAQFWAIKQNHYDTVLFFQKGKFYELYEEDATIGHQEFDLKLTDRVKMRMQSLEYWIQKFLGAGYKVGVVEQAETAIGMQMRNKGKKPSAGEGIVNRELRHVFTNGTIVNGTFLSSDEANHCVAIKEFVSEVDDTSAFGVCIMDASTGSFELSAFEDDICRTKLETMFRQIRPKELVHAKGNLSVHTTRMLRNILPSATQWSSFKEGSEFCSAQETRDRLGDFFAFAEDELATGKPPVPEAIRQHENNQLAMEALGGLLFYLRSLQLDKDLVSQSNFNVYDPLGEGKSLVLDGQTLAHMEVLVNGDGGLDGTLLQLLQRCTTPFGKRLFRIWLTSPLRDAQAINER